jgi:predicted membrane protein
LATLTRYSDLRLAAALFVAGWALFWASVLNLIAFVPLWLALAFAIAGLLMIPLSMRQKTSAPAVARLAEQPAKL